VVRSFDVKVCRSVFVFRSSLFSDIEVFLAARTVVSVFLTDMDLFLSELGFLFVREGGGERRVLPFPSDALLCLGKIDFGLDVSLSDMLLLLCCYGAVPVRRREKAEGDRNSCVKVQVDDLRCENSSRMPFDVPKGITRRISAS